MSLRKFLKTGDILKTIPLLSRGNKAENAAKFGCAALIIFSDPAEAAQEGTEPEHVYPASFWLPGTGVQRGSLALADGDPLTPNWPSVDHAYRLDSEERQVRSAEKTRANSLRSCFKRAPCFALSCPLRMISAHYVCTLCTCFPNAMHLHCKKRLEIFLSPAGMSLTKHSLTGNNLFFKFII
jgi:hypothetical protein